MRLTNVKSWQLITGTLVVVVGVGLLAVAHRIRSEASRQEEIVREISANGGRAIYDFEARGLSGPPGNRVIHWILGSYALANVQEVHFRKGLSEATARRLMDLDEVIAVTVFGASIQESVFQALLENRSITTVSIVDADISPASIKLIQKHDHVTNLSLGGISACDKNVLAASACRNLKSVHLLKAELSVETLPNLRNIDSLESLQITDVSQSGEMQLDFLADLSNLRELKLWKVSPVKLQSASEDSPLSGLETLWLIRVQVHPTDLSALLVPIRKPRLA